MSLPVCAGMKQERESAVVVAADADAAGAGNRHTLRRSGWTEALAARLGLATLGCFEATTFPTFAVAARRPAT